MKTSIILVSVFAAVQCLAMGHKPENIAADSAWLVDLQARLEKADTVFAAAGWQYLTTGEYPESIEETVREYFWLIFSDYNIKKLNRIQGLFGDSLANRAARLSYIRYLTVWSELGSDVRMLSDYLTDFILHYRAEFEGEQRTDNYLAQIVRNSSDGERRKAAWHARMAIGDTLAPEVIKLVRERNRLARRKEYSDYFEFRINVMGLTTDRVLGFLGMLNRATRDPYLEICQNKKEELGLDTLELWDISYESKLVAFDDLFIKDSLMSTLMKTFDALGFGADTSKVSFDINPRDDKYPYAMCIPVCIPDDIRVLASLEGGFDSYCSLFHEYGHALHLSHINQPYYVLRAGGDRAIGEAMAMFCENLLIQQEWLRKYSGLDESEIPETLEILNQIRIIRMRFFLAEIYFEIELYRTNAESPDKLFWDIMESLLYCGRCDGTNAWAAIPHFTTNPIYIQNYVLAELIAAQTMHHLQALNGEIIDNPATAEYLINGYYKFGALYNWFDLVEMATGEKLDTRYYLEDILSFDPDIQKVDSTKQGD